MEKITSLLDEHLDSLQGFQEAGTDDFFYTRLKARMEAQHQGGKALQGWSFPLKPVWVAATLLLLLGVNGFMLSQQSRTKEVSSSNSSPLQNFAESYDQTITTSY